MAKKKKDLRKEIVKALSPKIKLVYIKKYWKPIYSDDERYIEGYDKTNEEIIIREFDSMDKCEEFIGDLSVEEGESEGMTSFKIISKEYG